MSEDRVAAAEVEVLRARARFVATAHEVTRQLEPHRLMRELWDSAKLKGADLAEEAVDAVSRRPVAAGAVIAGIAAFLVREPLIDLASQLAGGVSNKRKARKRRKAKAELKDSETVE